MISVEAEVERMTGEAAAPSIVVSLEDLRELTRKKKPEVRKFFVPSWGVDVFIRQAVTVGEILTLEDAADKLKVAQQAGGRVPPGYESVFYDVVSALLVDANGERFTHSIEGAETLRKLPGMGIVEVFQCVADMQGDLSAKVEEEAGN